MLVYSNTFNYNNVKNYPLRNIEFQAPMKTISDRTKMLLQSHIKLLSFCCHSFFSANKGLHVFNL